MQKGDVLELTIESVGMDGEGVAKQDGMVIFVPFTLVGEIVKCEITFVKKSFAKAKVIKLLKASEHRVNPICPHFRKCGGCDMQHINYQRQLEIKKENIINCFKKYAGLDVNINEVVPSKDIFYYRNKAQFPLFERNGKVCLGFYKEKTSDSDRVRRQIVHAVCGHSQQISAHGIHRLPSNAVEDFHAAFMGHLQEPFPHIRKSQKRLVFPVRIDITVIFFCPECPDSRA